MYSFNGSTLFICAVLALPCLAVSPSVQAGYGQLPLTFEANRGQTDSNVKFLAHGDGCGLFLTPEEAVLTFADKGDVLRMRFAGASRNPKMEGVGQVPVKTNYLIGNDPAKWRHSVANYQQIRYRDVYPGIDVIYYGKLRQLEYDLIVAPGADTHSIRLSFPGIKALRIDTNGDLVLNLPGGEVRQFKPKAYQEIDGRKVPVDANFVALANKEIGFQLARYDRSKPLIIDPVYSYPLYLAAAVSKAY